MLVGDLIRRNAQLYPNRLAWVYAGTTWTWAEANRRVNAVAHALLGIGLQRGDRVAFLGGNTARLAELYFALAKARLVAVPLQPTLVARELASLVRDAQAAAVIVDGGVAPQVEAAKAELPEVRWWIGMGRGHGQPLDYERLQAKASSDEPRVAAEETALRAVLYTSTTSGLPRGCLSTHRQFLQSIVVYATQLPFTPDDICLLVLPLSAGVGAYLLTAYTYAAACTVILRRPEPTAILEAVERHRATRLYLVPTLLQALLDHPDFARYDLSSLRLVGWGGSPVATATVRQAVERLGGHRLYQSFGEGEAGGFVAYLYPSDHQLAGLTDAARARAAARLASRGREAPFVRLRVADDSGREVPRGAVGELLVRADSVMSGYWRQPEESARVLHAGWLHTGELATMDADGYVTIVDRKLEMIVSSGLNVNAAEVEAVLYEHPCVQEAAVIGVPDAHWGESVKALVVLREGVSCTAEELLAHCQERLASHERPQTVELLPSFPKSSVGKILKRELRERYWVGSQRRE